MLVLSRHDGDWIEVMHSASGDTLRFRVRDFDRVDPSKVNIAFHDPERRFEISRPAPGRSFLVVGDGRASQERADATSDPGPPEPSPRP